MTQQHILNKDCVIGNIRGTVKELLQEGQDKGWTFKPPFQIVEGAGGERTIFATFEEYTHPLESAANKQIDELARCIMSLYPEWIGVHIPGGAEIEGGEGAVECAIRLLTRKKDEGFNFVQWLINVEKATNKELSQFNFDEETLRTMYNNDFLTGTTPEKMAEWEQQAKQSAQYEWMQELNEILKAKGITLDMNNDGLRGSLYAEGKTPTEAAEYFKVPA